MTISVGTSVGIIAIASFILISILVILLVKFTTLDFAIMVLFIILFNLIVYYIRM